jgi:hypothetical protein
VVVHLKMKVTCFSETLVSFYQTILSPSSEWSTQKMNAAVSSEMAENLYQTVQSLCYFLLKTFTTQQSIARVFFYF